ncbi:MAG: 50S ribosomal protein L21 [Acidimicrobiia bacterium]|nr:50S ribosomal protein L21 [Acidimicrobiia bacterium]
MYAIIRTGGKQAKVRPGDVIDVERLKDAGDEIEFTPILVVGDDGAAITDAKVLSTAKVTARVLGENRGPKIDIFKYKNKTGYRRRMGHRQTYTRIEVTDIAVKAKKGAAKVAKAAAPVADEEE